MSEDLIERSDAIKAVCYNCGIIGHVCKGSTKTPCDDVKAIMELPSADRPQGEWIDIGTFSHSYKCSVCGRTLFNITVGKNRVAKYYPYCHCGARMKGADDD